MYTELVQYQWYQVPGNQVGTVPVVPAGPLFQWEEFLMNIGMAVHESEFITVQRNIRSPCAAGCGKARIRDAAVLSFGGALNQQQNAWYQPHGWLQGCDDVGSGSSFIAVCCRTPCIRAGELGHRALWQKVRPHLVCLLVYTREHVT